MDDYDSEVEYYSIIGGWIKSKTKENKDILYYSDSDSDKDSDNLFIHFIDKSVKPEEVNIIGKKRKRKQS
jgi:hypothetical protein